MPEKGMERKILGSRIGCEVNKCLGPAYSNFEEGVQGPWPVVRRYAKRVVELVWDQSSYGGSLQRTVLPSLGRVA